VSKRAERGRDGLEARVAEADAQLDAAHAEIERLQAEVRRLTEENHAFVSSARLLTKAAEEVLAEARREAAETRARAAAEAYERLVVARADARAAVLEERTRTAAEIELLAEVRERLADERATLRLFQDQLSGRLRDLVRAVFDFEERQPTLGAGPSWDGAPSRPESATGSDLRDGVEADVVRDGVYVEAVVIDDRPSPTADVDPGEDAEHELEAAFAAFFSPDVEGEPSRSWILNGP
jgi:hypothetical protein